MPKLTMIQAINRCIHEEMGSNEDVVILGEDIGRRGGVFGTTEGLYDKFGKERVIDTPLCETGILGAAIGMALYGLKPIAEIQFLDFLYPGFDQVVSELAKFRYRSGGQYPSPVVVRAPSGGGIRGGHYHSQSSEAYFCHTPGLQVVMPATARDAKGMLATAIRGEDPVMFLEPKILYRSVSDELPDEPFEIEFGKARLVREGSDVTLVSWGAMVRVCEEAAKTAEENGVSCEVIDLRSLVPLDEDTVLNSVAKTGRAVIVCEAPMTGSFAGEIAAILAERATAHLEGPVVRICGFDTPFPYTLEHVYLPDAFRVWKGIQKTIDW